MNKRITLLFKKKKNVTLANFKSPILLLLLAYFFLQPTFVFSQSGPQTADCRIEILNADFPTTVMPGQLITIKAEVKNTSALPIEATMLGFYKWIGGSRYPGPVPSLQAESLVPSLQPDETAIIQIEVQLSQPLFNVPAYPIETNNTDGRFFLMEKVNAGFLDKRNCNYLIDFDIEYPQADVALTVESAQNCMDENGVLKGDLVLTNLGNTSIEGDIYVYLGLCNFVKTTSFCKPQFNASFYIKTGLAPNESFRIVEPYQVPADWEAYEITANIDLTASNLADTNLSNNTVSASFTKSNCNTPIDCNEISLTGIPPETQGAAPAGIYIDGPIAPNTIVKIYNKNWERIKECNTCTLPFLEPLPAGDYIVQVQFYTESWEWICQSDNLTVTVPTGQTCAAVFFKDKDGDGFGDENDTVSGCSPPAGYVTNADDCDDTNAAIGAKQAGGTTCDDNDPNTNNDVIQSDGCTCKGMNTNTPSCEDINVYANPSGELRGNIVVEGLTAPIEITKIYNAQWQLVFECNNNCGSTVTFDEPEIGKYYVQVQMYTANWEWICQTENIEVIVEQNTDCAANLFLDEDGDGVCEGDDCDDNDPTIGGRQAAGTPCDDGNADTDNDVIQSDGCTCKGESGGMPNCDNIEFIITNLEDNLGAITELDYLITGFNAPIEIIKIFNRRTYERVFECNATCGEEIFVSLQEGEYVLQAQMYTENWASICNRAINFDVIIGDPGPGICGLVNAEIRPDRPDLIWVSGITSERHIVVVLDEAGNEVRTCTENEDGKHCNGAYGVLTSGTYSVSVKLYDINWQYLCETTFTNLIVPSATNGSRAIDKTVFEIATYPKAQTVQLEWIAGQISQTDYFVVERSMDGEIFEPLAEVIIPVETDQFFQWTDSNPQFGVNYYRVNQAFFNQENRHSSVKSVDFQLDKTAIAIFPNPAQTTLQVQIEALKGRKGSIQIFNAYGQVMEYLPAKVFDQKYETIDVQGYENGLYYLQIKAANRRMLSRKFLVERLR